MKVRLTNEQLKQLAGFLEDTDLSPDAAAQDVLGLWWNELDDTSIQSLETLVFRCLGCSTWKAIQEQNGGDVCLSCARDWEEEIFGPATTIPCSDLNNAISLADDSED